MNELFLIKDTRYLEEFKDSGFKYHDGNPVKDSF